MRGRMLCMSQEWHYIRKKNNIYLLILQLLLLLPYLQKLRRKWHLLRVRVGWRHIFGARPYGLNSYINLLQRWQPTTPPDHPNNKDNNGKRDGYWRKEPPLGSNKQFHSSRWTRLWIEEDHTKDGLENIINISECVRKSHVWVRRTQTKDPGRKNIVTAAILINRNLRLIDVKSTRQCQHTLSLKNCLFDLRQQSSWSSVRYPSSYDYLPGSSNWRTYWCVSSFFHCSW